MAQIGPNHTLQVKHRKQTETSTDLRVAQTPVEKKENYNKANHRMFGGVALAAVGVSMLFVSMGCNQVENYYNDHLKTEVDADFYEKFKLGGGSTIFFALGSFIIGLGLLSVITSSILGYKTYKSETKGVTPPNTIAPSANPDTFKQNSI